MEQLATLIRLGVYPRGSTLPPERELAERLAVSAGHPARGDGRHARGRTGPDHSRSRRRHRWSRCGPPPRRPAPRPDVRKATRRDWMRRTRLPPDRRARRGRARGRAGPRREAAQAAPVRPRVGRSRARGPAMHRQADSRFHLTMAALSGSSRVVESVTAVQATLHEMLSAIPVLEANIAHSDTQHARIVKAILAGRSRSRATGDGRTLRRHRRVAARAARMNGPPMKGPNPREAR